ncbi:MAG: GNAT family N-acetyltransferase [Candidatus Dormibacteria bacterium]
MSLLDRLKEMALCSDAPLRIIEDRLSKRCVELVRCGNVVVTHANPASIKPGSGVVSAWIVYYDADPALQGQIRLELESYQPGRGMVQEPAYANLIEDHNPVAHLLLADLLVHDHRRRNNSIGTYLVDAAKAIAAERRLPLYGNLSDIDDVDRLLAFYKRLGFEVEIYDAPSMGSVGQVRWTPGSPAE